LITTVASGAKTATKPMPVSCTMICWALLSMPEPYAPRYPGVNGPPLDAFRYEPYTHACVPQDHFDAVGQEGAWTFTRRGDGYLARYSWRPTEWVANQPQVIAANGMTLPFDRRAAGGADNVWIVECGRAADWELRRLPRRRRRRTGVGDRPAGRQLAARRLGRRLRLAESRSHQLRLGGAADGRRRRGRSW
jgi:hypothetical protein